MKNNKNQRKLEQVKTNVKYVLFIEVNSNIFHKLHRVQYTIRLAWNQASWLHHPNPIVPVYLRFMYIAACFGAISQQLFFFVVLFFLYFISMIVVLKTANFLFSFKIHMRKLYIATDKQHIRSIVLSICMLWGYANQSSRKFTNHTYSRISFGEPYRDVFLWCKLISSLAKAPIKYYSVKTCICNFSLSWICAGSVFLWFC